LPHTYAQNAVHVVFSTEGRLKLIPKELQPRMWAYVIGVCKNQGIYVHAIGDMVGDYRRCHKLRVPIDRPILRQPCLGAKIRKRLPHLYSKPEQNKWGCQ
jgi:hypothetical protein